MYASCSVGPAGSPDPRPVEGPEQCSGPPSFLRWLRPARRDINGSTAVGRTEGRKTHMRKLIVLLTAALALLVAAPSSFAAQPKDNDTHVQLLAINDFHGHLEPSTPGTIRYCCELDTKSGTATPVVVTRPAGGVEYLATLVKQLRDRNSDTITVGAGDMIGAS